MSKRTKRLKIEAGNKATAAVQPAFRMDVTRQKVSECAAIARQAFIRVVGQDEFDRRFKAYKSTDVRDILNSFNTKSNEALGWLVIYLDSIGLGHHYLTNDPGLHKDFNLLHGLLGK